MYTREQGHALNEDPTIRYLAYSRFAPVLIRCKSLQFRFRLRPPCNLRSKPTTSCFLSKIFGPEGTEVNSRGRALCAKPTGVKQQGLKTLKGSNNQPGSTLSGSTDVTD